MRSTADRIRHAISFEIIGLILIAPVVAFLFHLPTTEVGMATVIGATLAAVWTYLYNLAFDHIMRHLTGSTAKGWMIRVVHAVMYEVTLLVVLMPLFAWYLNIDWLEAFLLDIAMAVFYAAYAFVFNLAYDRLFPVPGEQGCPG